MQYENQMRRPKVTRLREPRRLLMHVEAVDYFPLLVLLGGLFATNPCLILVPLIH